MKPNPYATVEETASVIRPATPDESWLYEQLDRINPHRLEMGSAGDTPALVKLALELRAAKMRLEGEAGVMRELLLESHSIIETIEAEDEGEFTRLATVKRQIKAIIDMRVVKP